MQILEIGTLTRSTKIDDLYVRHQKNRWWLVCPELEFVYQKEYAPSKKFNYKVTEKFREKLKTSKKGENSSCKIENYRTSDHKRKNRTLSGGYFWVEIIINN